MSYIKCDQCSCNYSVMAVIDSEVWEKIANGDYSLCPVCMDERLTKIGVKTECDLVFHGLSMTSVQTDRIRRAAGWRPRHYVADGTVGLPQLYGSI